MKWTLLGLSLAGVAALAVSGCTGVLGVGQPTVSLNIDNTTIAQDGLATITATVDTPSIKPVEVNLNYGGTALSGKDYTRSAMKIIVPAFAKTGTVTIRPIQNGVYQDAVDVTVDVASVTNGAMASGQQPFTVTITNNNAEPTVSLSLPASADTLPKDGKTPLDVTATLSNASSQDVTVNLAFSGEAAINTDYSASATSVTIPARQTSGKITLTGIPQDLYVNGKTIIVSIDSVINAIKTAASGGQQVTAYLQDSGAAPTATLSIDKTTIDANGGVATITCTLNHASGAEATVKFDVDPTSTAVYPKHISHSDYSVSSTDFTIHIPAGQTSGTLVITGKQRTYYTTDLKLILKAGTTKDLTADPSSPSSFTITIHDDPQRNKTQGETFLADNATKPGVVVLPDGLQYKIITAGTGNKPAATDTVSVKYTGTFIDGTVFDSSNGQAVQFQLNGLIDGWIEALQLMPVGSEWMLYIPYNLAYKDTGSPPKIGPYSALIFDITLVGIQGQ